MLVNTTGTQAALKDTMSWICVTRHNVLLKVGHCWFLHSFHTIGPFFPHLYKWWPFLKLEGINDKWRTHCANALSMNSSIISIMLESIVLRGLCNTTERKLIKKRSIINTMPVMNQTSSSLTFLRPFPSFSCCLLFLSDGATVSFIAKPHRSFQKAHVAVFSSHALHTLASLHRDM